MVTPIDQFYELCFDDRDAWLVFQLKAVHTGDAQRDVQALTAEPPLVVLVPRDPVAWGAGQQWYAYASELAVARAREGGAPTPVTRILSRDKLPPGLQALAGSPADET